MGRLDNFGIRRVERLDGNIGYIDLRRVAVPANAGPAITAAMELVAGTYALIIDMRHNGGGAPEGVVFWCSYLFGREAHPPQRHLPRRHRRDQAVLDAPLRAGNALPRPAGVLADQRAHLLRRRGPLLHVAGTRPGRGDRRDDWRRGPPDPGVPGQRGGAYRGPVRALGQPRHRHQLARHRGRARHGGARGEAYDVAYARALERVLAMDDLFPPIEDEARDALAGLGSPVTG